MCRPTAWRLHGTGRSGHKCRARQACARPCCGAHGSRARRVSAWRGRGRASAVDEPWPKGAKPCPMPPSGPARPRERLWCSGGQARRAALQLRVRSWHWRCLAHAVRAPGLHVATLQRTAKLATLPAHGHTGTRRALCMLELLSPGRTQRYYRGRRGRRRRGRGRRAGRRR